ncbi:hypothetical protein [Clostridium butyricum]|jgi:hypothetical protein
MDNSRLNLPTVFRNRNIFTKVIPTVCNLKNMLNHLEEYNWDFRKLKQWEKRSYKAYNIESIITELKQSLKENWSGVIKEHILTLYGDEIGASCVDIYLVAYAAINYGIGSENMYSLVQEKNISDKIGSSNAIYQVGKGDGVYLGILDDSGRIIDTEFFDKWIDNL